MAHNATDDRAKDGARADAALARGLWSWLGLCGRVASVDVALRRHATICRHRLVDAFLTRRAVALNDGLGRNDLRDIAVGLAGWWRVLLRLRLALSHPLLRGATVRIRFWIAPR